MKKVLITGANGFVGSFMVEEAIRRGYDVYAAMRAERILAPNGKSCRCNPPYEEDCSNLCIS